MPDLYREKIAVEVEEAEGLMGKMNWLSAVEDVRTSANYLRSEVSFQWNES